MPDPELVALCPTDAAALLGRELAAARAAAAGGSLDETMDGYVRALGLALQLGPALTERVLRAVLDDTGILLRRHGPGALAALGPALVDIVDRVEESDSLPETPVMEAWAGVASDLAATIGQLGLALALPPGRRDAVLDTARRRIALLDDATAGLFALPGWLEALTG
jgi:hypothetical protein